MKMSMTAFIDVVPASCQRQVKLVLALSFAGSKEDEMKLLKEIKISPFKFV